MNISANRTLLKIFNKKRITNENENKERQNSQTENTSFFEYILFILFYSFNGQTFQFLLLYFYED